MYGTLIIRSEEVNLININRNEIFNKMIAYINMSVRLALEIVKKQYKNSKYHFRFLPGFNKIA